MIFKTHLANTIIEEEVIVEQGKESIQGVTLTDINGKPIKRAKEVYRCDCLKGQDIISLLIGDDNIITFIISKDNNILHITDGYTKVGTEPYTVLDERLIEIRKSNAVCLYDLEKREVIARITKTERGYQVTYKLQIDDTNMVLVVANTDKSFNVTNSTLRIPELNLDFSVEDNCNIIELIKNDAIDEIIESHLPIIIEKLAKREEKIKNQQRKRTKSKEVIEAKLHTKKEK